MLPMTRYLPKQLDSLAVEDEYGARGTPTFVVKGKFLFIGRKLAESGFELAKSCFCKGFVSKHIVDDIKNKSELG